MPKFTLHKRSIARIAAIQSLYQMHMLQQSKDQVLSDFKAHFEADLLEDVQSKKYDKDFFAKLLKGVSHHLKELDPFIRAALPEDWALERLDIVLLCIMRAGAFELWQHPETDSAVIINEYLNVTHAFYDEKEPGFVNGVLHKISTSVRG